MDERPTSFEWILERVSRRMGKAQKALEFLQSLTEARRMDIACEAAFDLAREVERMAVLARSLPAYTGHPKAHIMAEEMIAECVPVDIGYTNEGWFAAFLPMLLPKKEKGSANYIREIIYPALRRFHSDKVPMRCANCVLIFRHVYNRSRPERAYRDHDNIELNMVVDAVALYAMKDDSALRCAHYYCSAVGSEDRTEVFVVPQSEFMDWLTAEKSFPKEGVRLHENSPKSP